MRVWLQWRATSGEPETQPYGVSPAAPTVREEKLTPLNSGRSVRRPPFSNLSG